MFLSHHVAITVTDSKKSMEFYKRFGFEDYKSWEAEDGSVGIYMLKLNDVFLELICYQDFYDLPENAKLSKTVGVKHFALGVEDIEKAKKFILDNSLSSNIDIKIGKLGKPYFFITDPDGIQVEIIEK